jgi:Gas vesicle synthesis protein GvpL/GvpF
VLYLYALSEHPTVVPALNGVDDTPLSVERLDAIDAVVGVVERERMEPSEAAILAHARVVDELAAANAAVLPARFGRGYADADALRSAVSERSAALEGALERVRGCQELGLRVLARKDEAPRPDGNGREYMRARLQARLQAERLADELHAPLAALARAETHSVGATPELLLSAAYLVPRDAVDGFRTKLEELGREHPELTLACTGPWPAYSFATAEAGPR